MTVLQFLCVLDVYKRQTYDTVFVDVNNMVYDRMGHPYANQDDLLRRLYVGCSRAVSYTHLDVYKRQ